MNGPGGTLAYANPLPKGNMFYDSEEKWSDGPVKGAYDMGSVIGLHELGHVLGLAHTSVENAAMFPTIKSGVTKGLADDDIQGNENFICQLKSIGIFFYCMDIARLATNLLGKKKQQRGNKLNKHIPE